MEETTCGISISYVIIIQAHIHNTVHLCSERCIDGNLVVRGKTSVEVLGWFKKYYVVV